MSPDRPLRVLVVDDEAPARAKLRGYLERDGPAEVIGEAADGFTAVEQIEALRPDVVLLDVQMPGLSGFDVITALAPEALPHIIFVTAHDEHAVEAFEVRALDYLLKPVDRDRLMEALSRIPDSQTPRQDLSGMTEPGTGVPQRVDRFLVRERGRLLLIPVEEVDWIGAAGNYVELHVGQKVHLIRGTLQALSERLSRARFIRIHRSTIVNLDRVSELQPWSHGDLLVVLTDGTELKLSRRYRGRLDGIFGS